jgi:hypothetical protein
MFLVVFATIVIALLGTYTQVLGVEIARIAAAQTSFARAMLSWHTAAMSMAASVIDTNSAYNTTNYPSGCALTNDKSSSLSSFHYCPGPINSAVSASPIETNGTVTGALSSPPYATNLIYDSVSKRTECVHLPTTTCSASDPSTGNCTGTCTTTFDAKSYEFYSVLYHNGGSDYVVTFASAPNTAGVQGSNYLTLAGGKQVSLTASDLLKQLRNVGLSNFTYGTVTNSVLTAGSLQYTLPTAANIPSGAIALIGFPDGF